MKFRLYILLLFVSSFVFSQNFHDTKGTIDVNNSGQLQFTLPIALPPGVKSVAPQINLSYTSGSGNGIAGYGFSLSGITSISRIGKNIEKDGNIEGVKLDYTDFYQFNGQRLVLKSGEYGKDGAEYYTEKHSNIKIKSIGTLTGLSYKGPESFEVTFEDGSQAWYGLGNAKTPSEYNISKWKDAQGNYITYNYTLANNVAVIASIQWGGNEVLVKPHFNTISFSYIGRNLQESAYINGEKFIQDKFLKTISVIANNQPFKKYVVKYINESTSVGYKFVDSITEYNSLDEAANPVKFNYEPTATSGWNNIPYLNNQNNVKGDFNGDGDLDFLSFADSYQECSSYETLIDYYPPDDPLYPNQQYTYQNCVAYQTKPGGIRIHKSYLNNYTESLLAANNMQFTQTEFSKAIAISYVTATNEISNKQGVLVYKTNSIAGSVKKDLELQVYSVNPTSFDFEYKKTINADDYDNSYSISYSSGQVTSEDHLETNVHSIKELDVDGNGISELVLILQDYYHGYSIDLSYGDVNADQGENSSYDYFRYRYIIINMDRNITGNSMLSIANYFPTDRNVFIDNNSQIADFDGNGKSDILWYDSSGRPVLVDFKKDLSSNKFIGNQLYFYNSNEIVEGLRWNALVGDFNGDGKTDLMIPVAEGSSDWRLYLSTGKSFVMEYKTGLSYFKPVDDAHYTQNWYRRTIDYYAVDLDKDGKSEIVSLNCYTHQDIYHSPDDGNMTINVFKNKRSVDQILVNFSLDYSYSESYVDKLYDLGLIAGDFRVSNNIRSLIFLGKHRLNGNDKICKALTFYDTRKASRINKITQGDIDTEIIYRELDPAVNVTLYQPVKKEQYPFVELDKLSQSFVVAQLRQLGRKQDFLYRGFIANLQGRGMIGFRKNARSSWYADGFENTKIWSATEIDPLNYGVTIKNWTTKDSSILFSNSINFTTTGLLSLKVTEYDIKYFLNGVEITKPSIPTPNLVTVIVPKKDTHKDFLKDITTVNTVNYDTYFLPKSRTSDVNNGFATITTNLDYLHNITGTGNAYYVGKLSSKIESVTAYGDTKQTKEEYTYTNNLLDKIKKYNLDNSQHLLESYTYDSFGNITQKTITNSQDTQSETVKTVFDTKGCYVLQKKDNLNLTTKFTYNDWGQVLTQIDPLGNTITNEYDAWGKLLKSTHSLLGITTYSYQKLSVGGTEVIQNDPSGNEIKTYVNTKGEQYQKIVKSTNTGKYSVTASEYDILGRKIKESEPYLLNIDTPKWNTITYDDSVFPTKAITTAFNGKQVETRVEGRTTIIQELNGSNRITKKTTDPLGNVISSEDKGGTINFAYNAAGQNITATYGQNVVITSYDNWGRKFTFNDPSNGLYQYEYDGLGKLKKETSPKGNKQYAYNPLGQLEKQTEVSNDGVSTQKNINYTYDNKGLLTNKNGTVNSKVYNTTITYDGNGRTILINEEANNYSFKKENIVYDNISRVTGYDKVLKSATGTTTASIVNVYSTWDGSLIQLKEKNTNAVLWELQETKANGQVLRAKLGAVDIANSYDTNNFLTSVNQTVTNKPKVLGLTYTFDAIKNELNSRTRVDAFAINEQFAYDDNNRLVSWTNPKTGQLSSNTYDEKGRIIQNDQVGDITYENTSKIYQPTKMTLNTAGSQNYLNDIPQSITYNENNDPIFIDGQKGDVRFEYGLTEARQVVTYGGNFAVNGFGKFVKYYSEAGEFEVIVDKSTSKEKHIIYIEGTPYQSNIVLLKNFTDSGAKFVFLHKDYLGSILAITDQSGDVLESRHFDAWGNLSAKSKMILLDRGYTSHEHFAEVGIIHMNGRLYDPLMRRFLNADENIQDPNNTQCYNKYGYVMNNPLLFNDPDGEFAFLAFLALPVVKAILIGAAIGLATYVGVTHFSGRNVTLSGALSATLMGAVSGAVTFGIGSIFSSSAGTLTTIGKSLQNSGVLWLVQGGAHAISQGTLSLVQGEEFLSAAAGGFFGSLGASAWGAAGGKFAKSAVGTITFGALSGGVGAELTGGNFWTGAITGGIVAGLNHAMHNAFHKDPPNKYQRYFAQKAEEAKYLDKSLNLGSSATEAAIPIALTTSALDGPIPFGEIVGGIVIAGAATYDLTQRVYLTYTLRNSSGSVYVGRTSGYGNPYSLMMARYSGHHMRFFGYVNPTLDVAAQGISSYPAIRGREQQLIEFFGGVGSPTCGNRINGISPFNPLKESMMNASTIMFGPLK